MRKEKGKRNVNVFTTPTEVGFRLGSDSKCSVAEENANGAGPKKGDL